MSAYFTLVLDTQPPANPGLVVNSGAPLTGSRDVAVSLSTTDYLDGAHDVAQMKVWGDVDPAADPLVQPTESASAWQTFAADTVVRLATGDGRKYLYARLKDDVCNATVPISGFIDLDTSSPVVQITTAIDRGRISKVAPCDTALFLWQATLPFVRYQVRVVPGPGSPVGAGTALGTAHGSTGVVGVGTFDPFAPLTTTINGADLEAASPGDTSKCVKVFVQTSDGTWSP